MNESRHTSYFVSTNNINHIMTSLDTKIFNKISHDFMCPVCNNVLEEPSNLSCGHLFCRRCLDELLINRCPTCRKPFLIYEKNTVIPYIINKIESLRLKCPHDECQKNLPCLGKDKHNLYEHLLNECEYTTVDCLLCAKKVTRQNINKHLKEDCPYRIVNCPYGCDKKDQISMITLHISNNSCSRATMCPNCGLFVRRGDPQALSHHLITDCTNNIITCLCGEKMIPPNKCDKCNKYLYIV